MTPFLAVEGLTKRFDRVVGATCEDAEQRAEQLETDVCARLNNECGIFGDSGVLGVLN